MALLDPSSHIGRNHITLDIWLDRQGNPESIAYLVEVARYSWFRIRKGYDFLYERVRRTVLFPMWHFYRVTGLTLPHFLRRPSTANKLVRISHTRMPSYDGDAIYFRAKSSPNSKSHPDIRDTWDRLINGRLEIIPIPGTHPEIIQEPAVRDLAAVLRKVLDRSIADLWPVSRDAKPEIH